MLPFTIEQFFGVFATYNTAIWPAQIGAYALGALAVWAVFAKHPWASRIASGVLGAFWLWNGLVYHLGFFAPINPAAYAFAVLFVVQGLLFLWYGALGDRLALALPADWRSILGLVLIGYATFVYELLGYAAGHGWPRAPLFGVAPCPTTIFTFGILMLTTRPIPLWLLFIPVVWAAIGTTAAILLAVPEDLGMLASALLAAGLLPYWGFRRSFATSQ